VGETPLEASVTVLPGERTVELRRAGYIAASRAIALQQGATGEVALDPAIDPVALASEGGSLELIASESQATASVDGNAPELLRGPLLLPRGPHRVRLERGGFLPLERDVYVPLRENAKVEVIFRPTPETRVDYVSHARRRRNWSWATLGLGVAVAAGGTTLAITQNHALPGARRELALVNADWAKGGTCDFSGDLGGEQQAAECKSRLNHATNRERNLETARMTGWIVAGVGAGVIVTGLVLWLTGPALHKYDDAGTQLAAARSWRLTPQFSTRAVGAFLSARFY
jgi:type IV secretory pathway TrbD component